MLSQISFAFVAFAALATVQAFTPPEGLPNGVYTYNPADGTHSNIDGTIVSRDLSFQESLESRDLVSSSKFAPRWKGGACGNSIVGALDYASAVGQMENRCDGKTKLSKQNIYSISGNAMIFLCVYKANVCTVGDTANAKDSVSGHMLYELGNVDKECNTKALTKDNQHMTGYRRIDNIAWGLALSTESAC